MAWLESHTVLIRHRKLIDLSKQLRLKPVHVLGHLHVLWHAALEQREDGDLSSWSDDFIAASACFTGSSPQFVSLLESTGWLNEGRLIHDWLDYAGRYLESRYRTSNPSRLREIWKKHGRSWDGDDGRKRKPDRSQTKDGLKSAYITKPNQPTSKARSASDKLKERLACESAERD